MALYNEWEPYPAAWLRNLIAAGHIAPGRVDERSIVELTATELVGVVQFHAFAGIGIWSAGLRAAGWPDDRPVWTASLPCQPFSQAGCRRGFDDDRHLWPVYFELVRECRPDCILGEQVSSPDGRAWFDAVSADLESAGYAVGALNTCAAGVGAPHIRQRLYWCAVADADCFGVEEVERSLYGREPDAERGCEVGRMGHADRERAGRDSGGPSRAQASGRGARGADGRLGDEPRASGTDGGMGDADGRGRDGKRVRVLAWTERSDRAQAAGAGSGDGRRNPWAAVEWLACSDGKARPAQSGVRPLAPRAPGSVGQVRAYGNGLCLEQAATFVEAVMLELDARRAA